MTKQFSYNKPQKLKSRKVLEAVFAKKQSVNAFPVKLFYLAVEEADFPLKAGVGVSARNFKKAVDRNRIKRLLREAYRLNKTELLNFVQANNKNLALFILFVDKTLPDYKTIETAVKSALNKLLKQLENNQ